MEVSNGDPFPVCLSIKSLTVINMEGEFEVGEGLPKCSDGLHDFNIHFHFFFDIGSQPQP